jgi:hypothetical protein
MSMWAYFNALNYKRKQSPSSCTWLYGHSGASHGVYIGTSSNGNFIGDNKLKEVNKNE